MKNKKIGILTFHWVDNYGALLQCYALLSFILNLGYECNVINYIPPKIKKNDSLFRLKPSLFIKDLLFFKQHFLRRLQSNSFRKKFIKLSKFDASFDFLVVGSDQIWNLPMTYSDRAYFGIGFKNKDMYIISYAASLGQNLPVEYQEVFFENLKNISKISVREETAKSYISKGSYVDVQVVLDPVFLLSKKDWLNIIPRKRLINKPYIFVYSVDNGNDKFVKIVDKISEYLNLGVVCSGKSFYRNRNYKNILKTYETGGPLIFLNYLFHSDFVVTSSFHGTAFSLILQKDFISVCPSSNASRLTDLLKRFDCYSRIITDISELNKNLLKEKIDYQIICERLDFEIEKSASWLTKALNEN